MPSETINADNLMAPAVSEDTLRDVAPNEPASFGEAQRKRLAIQEELTAILASPSFRSSRKSCEFLRYVVEVTLDGRIDSLKERTIGLDLLGRDLSYDPSSDATVRVRANEVRKRLVNHYAIQCPCSGYRIELRPGSYGPRFVSVEETATAIAVGLRETELGLVLPKAIEQVEAEKNKLQAIVPPLNRVDVMRPALIALFVCALLLRQQILSDDPYHQFWNTRLEGRTALVLPQDATSGSVNQAMIPMVWLAGHYNLKSVLALYGTESTDTAPHNNAITVESSFATPIELAGDKRLRYWVAGEPGALRLVDRQADGPQPVRDSSANRYRHAAILTLLPERPDVLWVAGTDEIILKKLIDTIADRSAFPARLARAAALGGPVQMVMRDDPLQIEMYTQSQ